MPVIPSFSAFAKGPDLASAYLGSARIAQQGQEAAARIGVEREKIAQDQAQAQLSFALKQQQLEQDHLADQQRIEVSKQYHQIQASLKEQQLGQAEQAIQAKAMQASRSFQASQRYQQLTQGGMDPVKAATTVGPDIGAGFPAAMRIGAAGQKSPMDYGAATPLPGAPGMLQAQTGQGSRRIFAVPKAVQELTARPIRDEQGNVVQGVQDIGGKPRSIVQSQADKDARADIKRLVDLQSKDDKGETAFAKKKAGKELGPAQQDDLTRYEAREKKIEALKQKISAGPGPGPGPARATLPESMSGQLKTNRIGRFNIISHADEQSSPEPKKKESEVVRRAEPAAVPREIPVARGRSLPIPDPGPQPLRAGFGIPEIADQPESFRGKEKRYAYNADRDPGDPRNTDQWVDSTNEQVRWKGPEPVRNTKGQFAAIPESQHKDRFKYSGKWPSHPGEIVRSFKAGNKSQDAAVKELMAGGMTRKEALATLKD